MNTPDERKAFRRRLEDLTDVELTQRMFLCGLVARIECEMLAYHALFEPAIEPEPAPDTELATMQYLLSAELKKRSGAKAKLRKLLPTEGETNHANHEQTGSD